LLFEFTEIGDFTFGRGRDGNLRGDFDGGENDFKKLRRVVGYGMGDAGRKVRKIVHNQRLSLLGEMKDTTADSHEENFFLARVGDSPTFAAWPYREFTEASDTERITGFSIAFAEQRRVATGVRGEIGLIFAGSGEIATEPGWLDGAILS
jgi:hypothetical protein